MSFLELLADSAWITAVGTVIGSIVTFLITKSKNQKEMSMSDRVQLSKDQYQLISELRQMMQEQRDEIDNLREEIKQLQAVNVSLIIENKELQQKIAELNIRLSKMSRE